MLSQVLVGAVAIVVAALIVPGFGIRWGKDPLSAVLTAGALGLIFGLVNAWLRPILRLVSLPLNLLTLGLFSFVVNAGLLLLVAAIADIALPGRARLQLGGFPPTLDAEALVAAVLGSLVVSAAATVLSVLSPRT
jgi:putative membrane protein